MAVVVTGNKVKLDNGQVVNAQNGGWYDGQQFFDGKIGATNVINNPNQQGYNQQVSQEVVAQTNPANVAYIQQKQQQAAPQQQMPATPMPAANPTQGMNDATGAVNLAMPTTPTINVEELFKKYYDESGVSGLEQQLSKGIEEYNKAQSAINDDPFLAEGNRVGRVQKLSTDFDNRVANIKNDIATKKADVEMKLQLAQKQFDINSQQAQTEFAKFQSLLQMGALDNASGEAIASITRATGLSSDLIYSAIKTNKAKNVQTQIISFDDGENQGFAVIDPQTGEIINKQVISASAKSGSGGSGLLDQKRQFEVDKQQAPTTLLEGAKLGKTFDDMVSYGAQFGIDPKTVLDIYLGVNYYKNTETQIKAAKKKYGIK